MEVPEILRKSTERAEKDFEPTTRQEILRALEFLDHALPDEATPETFAKFRHADQAAEKNNLNRVKGTLETARAHTEGFTRAAALAVLFSTTFHAAVEALRHKK